MDDTNKPPFQDFRKLMIANIFNQATRQRSARPHNGYTKNHSKSASKVRRKMAAQSRRINRGKK